MDYRVILLLVLEGLAGLCLLYSAGVVRSWRALARCGLLLFLALAIRWCFFNDTNTDYTWFLKVWVDHYRTTGFAGLKDSIGNYNIPYLYFLALFAQSGIYDLYLIKLLSCLFDILLAYAGMQLIRKCGGGNMRGLIGFFLVLFLPTVILNSGKWGQCDSLYVAFGVFALELGLPGTVCGAGSRNDAGTGNSNKGPLTGKIIRQASADRLTANDSSNSIVPEYESVSGLLKPARADGAHPLAAMICLAVSFGFKLQAVFLMPVFLVLWIWRKYSWKYIAAFPLTYLALILPAVLLGRPLWDAVALYINQAETVGTALNYNSPSLTALLRNISDTEGASKLLIAAAFAGMSVLLAAGMIGRKRLTPLRFALLTCLTATLIPFLLPHMHDRYFYAADVLSALLAVCLLPMIPAAVLTEFGSFVCYLAYFTGYYTPFAGTYLTNGTGAWGVLIALGVEAAVWIWGLSSPRCSGDKHTFG